MMADSMIAQTDSPVLFLSPKAPSIIEEKNNTDETAESPTVVFIKRLVARSSEPSLFATKPAIAAMYKTMPKVVNIIAIIESAAFFLSSPPICVLACGRVKSFCSFISLFSSFKSITNYILSYSCRNNNKRLYLFDNQPKSAL